LLIACHTLVVSAATPEDQQRFADGLFTRGLHEMALKEYNTLLNVFPDYAQNDQVFYRAAECCRKSGQVEQAMAYFGRLIELYPKGEYSERARLRLSELHVQRGEFGNAIIVLKKLLVMKPASSIESGGLYYMGFSYSKLQQIEKANQQFDDLLKRFPDSPFTSYAAIEKAKNLRLKGDADPAAQIALFRKAAANPPSDRAGAEALASLADALLQTKAYAESSETFDQLFKTYPKAAITLASSLNAAWAHSYAGAHARCLAQVQQADPTTRAAQAADWLYLEANALRHLGRDAEAATRYNILLAKHAASSFAGNAAYEVALISFNSGQYAEVIRQAGAMLAIPDLRLDGLWLIAESQRALGKGDEAITHFQLILKEFKDASRAAEASYNMALIHQKAGRNKEASGQYRSMTSEYPKHELAPRALFAAGYCAALENDFPTAIKDWQKVEQIYPDHELATESLFQKGLAEMQLKQENAATVSFKALLNKKPDQRLRSESNYWLGIMLERSHKPAEAETYLRQALAEKIRDDLVPGIHFRLAMVLQKQGKKDEAADFLQALVSRATNMEPGLLEWLVRHRIEQKKYAEAIPPARRLTSLAMEDKWKNVGWGLLGLALEKNSQPDEAIVAYREGIKMESMTDEVVDGAIFVGEHLFAAKAYADAIAALEAAADYASRANRPGLQARAYYLLGQTHEAAGHLGDAARFYMSVAVLYDDPALSPECLYRAAAMFGKLGNAKEQKQALKELAERYADSEWQKKAQGE
jgi:TolA-binding protein